MALFSIIFVFAALLIRNGSSLNIQRFQLFGASKYQWTSTGPTATTDKVQFFVGIRNQVSAEEIHAKLLEVSKPTSPNYGKYYSKAKIENEIYASKETREKIVSWLRQNLGSSAQIDHSGAFIDVRTSTVSVEKAFNTKLGWYKHVAGKRAIRATKELENIPVEVASYISFISLNAPIMATNKGAIQGTGAKAKTLETVTTAVSLTVIPGNKEAMVKFTAYCADGSINQQSPPCSGDAKIPKFTAVATLYANNRSAPFFLEQDELLVEIPESSITCYNSFTATKCAGSTGNNCTCLAKVAPLPKYQQIKIALFESSNSSSTKNIGNTTYFALTDVATPDFLSRLYNIPKGLSVKHGSTQGCSEFYGDQYFSNADLAAYLALSGLPSKEIAPDQCFGTLPYDETKEAGGEAQLDVELLMGIAVGADTFFYNYNDSNPYSASNEGFLAWTNTVSKQETPPLVFSVSYGDIEATVFNSSIAGASEYGMEVDTQFMLMGLRGLTIVFSSGDDGLASSLIRTEQEVACSQAWPEWPASSPYVLAVGATMMTDKPLPVCGKPYSLPSTLNGLFPENDYLLTQCSEVGETVCSASFGGVITSGGGFSDVYSREKSAPWQVAVVDKYLANPANQPPVGYYNQSGRAYPDVATYGSNFLVYLNGQIVRESGTSGSAPVMAAMVTLWNDMRLAYGLPSLGFINPFLYSVQEAHPEAFNDVVTGDNACGAGGYLTTAHCCDASFKASVGWDASTGLGSPNFQIIANLVVNPSFLFPASETVEAALPSSNPTTQPTLAPTTATASAAPSGANSASTNGATSPSSSYAPLSASGIAGAALFFSLVNTIALMVAGYYYWMQRKAAKQTALITDSVDKSTRGALYNPLNG